MNLPISDFSINSWSDFTDIDVLHPVANKSKHFAFKTHSYVVEAGSKSKLFNCPVCGGVHYFNLNACLPNRACATCGDIKLSVELSTKGE